MRLRSARTLLLCGLLAGIILAGIAFPVAAVLGLTAKAAGDACDAPPTSVRTPPDPQTSYLYASDGTTRKIQEARPRLPRAEPALAYGLTAPSP